MNAVDTNILIYVHDPRDPRTQEIADKLVTGLADGVLLWQVSCEFFSASRKLAPLGFDSAQACNSIRKLMTQWSSAFPTWKVLDRAVSQIDRFSLSFWDSVLIGACIEAGVEILFSEDFGGHDAIDGLTIVNPFLRQN